MKSRIKGSVSKPYTLTDVKLAIAYTEERIWWEAQRGNFDYANKLRTQVKIVKEWLNKGEI